MRVIHEQPYRHLPLITSHEPIMRRVECVVALVAVVMGAVLLRGCFSFAATTVEVAERIVEVGK